VAESAREPVRSFVPVLVKVEASVVPACAAAPATTDALTKAAARARTPLAAVQRRDRIAARRRRAAGGVAKGARR